jgi:hypothetical protein
MEHKLMYCVVKTLHVWCIIVYRQFHNYDGVNFLYCHVFDSNYRLPIHNETFMFEFIRFLIDQILSAVFRFRLSRFPLLIK